MPVHTLSDLVPTTAILAQVSAGSRPRLLRALAEAAAPIVRRPPAEVEAALAQREAQGTTALGGGVALPHARLAGLEQPVGLIAQLDRPVPWGALDGEPVDLALCLLSPAAPAPVHLRALARLTRALRDRRLVRLLRGARGRDSIAALLGGPPPAAQAA
jgi:PTS system nitrogen regulatory IIA component